MLNRLPRLSAKSAVEMRKIFDHGIPSFSWSDLDDGLNAPQAFPLTAGKPIGLHDLEEFRRRCVEAAAAAHGNAASFDLLVGAELYQFGQPYRGDLGNPQVWDFLTLILLPDVAGQRYSPRGISTSRFTGGNRRHVLQRLWRRWIVLGPRIVQSQKLTEDDYVALLERRITSEKPVLAQMTAEKIVTSGFTGHARRQYTRVFIKRLQQMSGVVFLDEGDEVNLRAVLDEVHERTCDEVKSSKREDSADH